MNFVLLLHSLAHIAFGALSALMLCPFEWQYVIAGALAAVLPDFDTNLGLAHRAQSHSILPPLVIYVFYASEPNIILLAILAGYVSHIFVDLLHGNGVMLFYPISRTNVSFAHVNSQYIFYASLPLLFFYFYSPPSEPPVMRALATPFQMYPTPTPTDWKGQHVTITIHTPTPTPTAEGLLTIVATSYGLSLPSISSATSTPTPPITSSSANFLTTIATVNAP